MKKPVVLLWKILKKSNFAYKTNAFLKKRVVKPISSHGFGPWVCNTRLDMLWGTLTDKLFREKQLVLLCFRSKPVSIYGFGPWVSHTRLDKLGGTLTDKLFREKSIGFTVFSLKNIEKALVLQCFRSKVLKNHWFYCVFTQKGSKTIGFIIEMQKSEKTIGFTVKKIQKEQKPL